jgi:hypothetical protein
MSEFLLGIFVGIGVLALCLLFLLALKVRQDFKRMEKGE